MIDDESLRRALREDGDLESLELEPEVTEPWFTLVVVLACFAAVFFFGVLIGLAIS